MNDQHALQAGTILDRYKIIRILGEGGFGITYLAEDNSLGLKVVIKEYFPNEFAMRSGDSTITAKSKSLGDFAKGMQRFKEEAQTLAKFNHPSIVKILGYFEANDTAYFVMEYEEGIDLSQYLKQHTKALSQEEILSIMMPVLEGLKEVHKYNYLHRDIKPGNILLRNNKSPVLIDFGASKLALGEASKSITSMLTEGYAPLEQYSTDVKQQGAFTDIYAVAAVMYKMITGKVPPSAQTRSYALLSSGEDPYKSLMSMKLSQYDNSFLKAIDRALDINANKRPQNIQEFQKDIAGKFVGEGDTKQKKKQGNWILIFASIVLLIISGAFFLYHQNEQQLELIKIQKDVEAKKEIAKKEKTKRVTEIETEKLRVKEKERIQKEEEAERLRKEREEINRIEKEKAEKDKLAAEKHAIDEKKKKERELASTLKSVKFKKTNVKKNSKFSLNDILFSTKGPEITSFAKKKLGRKYVEGARGAYTFDNSGFTMYVYKRNGIKIPRQVIAQSKFGKYIKRNNLKKGDLIFFDTSKERRGYVNHVGIYLGNGKFIHASSVKKKVVIAKLSDFYLKRYKGARRPR